MRYTPINKYKITCATALDIVHITSNRYKSILGFPPSASLALNCTGQI